MALLEENQSVFDLDVIRSRFPALARRQGGAPMLFFDNPAGTQLPVEAIEGYARYLRRGTANVGGAFVTSQETDRLVRDAREAMADFLGARDPREIVFGPNMTSLTFQVSHALGRRIKPGDEIVVTRLDHDANVAPWLALEERGAVIRWIDLRPEDGTLDLASAEAALSHRTVLLAVGLASNALGTVNDIPTLAEMAHAHGALVYVDAVHYGPHGPIDVAALACDLLVCSAYKFFGPHLGILWGRYDLLRELPAFRVRPAGGDPPGKWETGTQSFESLASLLGTIDYLLSLTEAGGSRRERLVATMSRIRTYERTLSERLIGGLTAIAGVSIYGITDPACFGWRVPTASFTVAGKGPAAVSEALGRQGIFSWAGNHYALEAIRRLGLQATNRVGLAHYNRPEEIDRFLGAVEEIARGG